MTQSKTDALEAISRESTRIAAGLDNTHNASTEAHTIRNLALAYRYAAGGIQPGSSVSEKA